MQLQVALETNDMRESATGDEVDKITLVEFTSLAIATLEDGGPEENNLEIEV